MLRSWKSWQNQKLKNFNHRFQPQSLFINYQCDNKARFEKAYYHRRTKAQRVKVQADQNSEYCLLYLSPLVPAMAGNSTEPATLNLLALVREFPNSILSVLLLTGTTFCVLTCLLCMIYWVCCRHRGIHASSSTMNKKFFNKMDKDKNSLLDVGEIKKLIKRTYKV